MIKKVKSYKPGILFTIAALLTACESKVDYEKPKDLIPKEQMTDLLYDMHLATASSNLRNINLERDRNYMSLVYEKYGIDSTRFAISNIYYTSKSDEYLEIFEEVERRLRELKDTYQNERDSALNAAARKTTRRGTIKATPDTLKKVPDTINRVKGIKH